MAQTKSVLLVDANPQESRALFSALVRAGHSVADTHTSDYALELLADRCFEVAILDLLSLGAGCRDLIEKLADDWSNPLIVGMADFASPVCQEEPLPRGFHAFVGKPIDVQQLVTKVSGDGPEAYGCQGSDIIEYLRCVVETGKDAQLEVRDLDGNLCRLFVSDRALVHAVCGDTKGEAALFRVLAFKGGSFSHVAWCAPEHVTIHEPAESLFTRVREANTESKPGHKSL